MAAETEIASAEPDSATRKYLSAASCYKKCDSICKQTPKLGTFFLKLLVVAVECLIKAIAIFVKNGRFHIAATHEKEIAEIYEKDLENIPKAIKYYLSSADRFNIEDSKA